MGKLYFSAAILLLILLIFHSYFQQADGYATSSATQNNRKTLERVIGTKNGDHPLPPPHPLEPDLLCVTPHPPPPPPKCLPPPPPKPKCLPPPPPKPICLPPPPPKPVCLTPPPPKPVCLTPPPPPVCEPELARDTRTIHRFRNRITTDPQGITNTWKGDEICTDNSTYRGFLCGQINETDRFRVAGVKFNGFHLDGNPLTVADFIEDLEDLVFFHANSNNFTGPIPAKIATLPFFYELDLSNNKLTGSFPSEVLAATNLTFLDLRFNQLSGTVPPQVFEMDLDVLFLNNNQFSGILPDNLGSTPVLYLTLANNRFTGPIPKSIGQASDTLIEVLFLNNQLSGCLPYEIGLLKEVTIFDASINQLTGRIPYSFGCMVKMQQLNMSFNQLYGEVPEIVCKLKNIYNLTLNNNYFTQVGPECRKLIMSNVLDVKMNCIFDLPLQRSSEECDSFFTKQNPCSSEQKTYRHVPCRVDNSSTPQEMSDRAPTSPPIAPSRSYAALIRHR